MKILKVRSQAQFDRALRSPDPVEIWLIGNANFTFRGVINVPAHTRVTAEMVGIKVLPRGPKGVRLEFAGRKDMPCTTH